MSRHEPPDQVTGVEQPAATRPGRISRVFLRALADVLNQRGIAANAQACSLVVKGSSPNADQADWLSLDEYAQIFSRAVTLADEPALGLLCGAAAIEPSFDVVGTLVAHTPTLRHAVEAARQFHPLLIDGAALHFHEHTGRAQLRCEFPRVEPTLDRALAELGAAGLWRMLRAFAVEHEAIHSVAFEHGRPSYHAVYSATFAGRQRFEQAYSGVEFASEALDRPNPHFQAELLAYCVAKRSVASRVCRDRCRSWNASRRLCADNLSAAYPT